MAPLPGIAGPGVLCVVKVPFGNIQNSQLQWPSLIAAMKRPLRETDAHAGLPVPEDPLPVLPGPLLGQLHHLPHHFCSF